MSSERVNVNRPELISPLKVNRLIKCVLIRVIDEQNSARHVVQSQIASAAPRDVAPANADHRLNREIIIRNFVRMTDKDIVIPHTSHCQTQCVVKATRFIRVNRFAGWEYVVGPPP